MAKLRPDLDEENFEELEKLRKLANSRPSDASLIDDLIIEELSRAARARPVTRRPIRRRPHLIHLHKPRTI